MIEATPGSGGASGSDPIEEHWDITMETAEIHSMSMEFFTEPWMNLFFKEEADTYRQMHLEDAIAFIPYGCMVDEFQHIVYSNPDLTPDERHAAWKKLRKNTNHILITKEIHLWKKVVFGKNSFTFMILRFII